MAISISSAYIETFEQNVRHLAQQGDTRLEKYCDVVNEQSESHNFDLLAASSARAKTAARMVSPAGGNGSGAVDATDGLVWTRRKSLIEPWDTGEVIEQEDPTQMIIDPNSAVTKNLAMNMRRAKDDNIIAAASGDSRDGAGGAVAYAGGTVGDGTTRIDIEKVLAVDEYFNAGDVDPDLPRVWVYGPRQKRDLMQLMEVTSGDFQSGKALASGRIPNWMGFDWVMSNRLLSDTDVDTDITNLAFTTKGIGFHIAKDITAKIGERTDMSFAWQFYCLMHIDAVRVEDEHVCVIDLANSPL